MTDQHATSSSSRIGLALSGGGIRAAVFHLGVLKQLADLRLLEQVSQISSVSGGSLIVGALFSCTSGRWPASNTFIKEVYPRLRLMLTEQDLFSFSALGASGALRHNIRILTHRAGILSDLLVRQWGVTLSLADLPENPRWHINTTCIETGKNWRFSRDVMGDWKFGRHYSPNIKLADAIAASAAVPYAIGALHLKLPADGWWQTDPATRQPIQRIKTAAQVRLWDGGVYENMGLEPVFKPSSGLLGCDVLFCSDASGPVSAPIHPVKRLIKGTLPSPRLMDISGDQIRSLRSRMLIHSVRSGSIDAFLIKMGSSARDLSSSEQTHDNFLTDEQCSACWNYPTNLKKIDEEIFDAIARHGSETTELTLRAHSQDRFFSLT